MGLPFERLFSMGAFDGLRSIRLQGVKSAGLAVTELVELIKSVDPDASGLDFEAAIALAAIVAPHAPLVGAHEFYRWCILDLFREHHQDWTRTIKQGRTSFLGALSRDGHHCFRSARLVDVPPTDDVVEWWDTLSGQVRRALDHAAMLRARQAERLSLDHETLRLEQLGIPRSPRWIAIDNNTAGYDILSYDPGPDEPINRLVEVKSTISKPLRFFVSRNEWNQAEQAGAAYVFHLWNLAADPPALYERTAEQVQEHIPSDHGKGKWTGAEIPVGQ